MPVVEDKTLVIEKTPRYFVWPGAAGNISMVC